LRNADDSDAASEWYGQAHTPKRERLMGSLATDGARLAEVFRVAPSFEIDPTMVITHTLPVAEGPKGFDLFVHKKDNCEKRVLKA